MSSEVLTSPVEEDENEGISDGVAVFFGLVFVAGVFILGWFAHGYFTKPDINLETAADNIEKLEKSYNEERKMRILYQSLEAGCRQDLNKEYEVHGIPAP